MKNIKIGVIGSNSFSGASFIDFALTRNLSVIGSLYDKICTKSNDTFKNSTYASDDIFYDFKR